MPTAKKISCLTCTKKSSCFNQLSDNELLGVDSNRVELKFKKGEIICKQGAFASHIMYLYSGLAKIYLETKEKNLILNIIRAGHLIGLPSLFNNNIFHYSAAAIDDCIVCSIDIEIFRKHTQTNALFASEIINILNHSTINSYDRFISLTQKHLNGRFADALLYLSKEVFDSPKFELALTRRDLAELTGMSTESVIRIIKDFKDDNILIINGKSFEILDFDKLQHLSEIG